MIALPLVPVAAGVALELIFGWPTRALFPAGGLASVASVALLVISLLLGVYLGRAYTRATIEDTRKWLGVRMWCTWISLILVSTVAALSGSLIAAMMPVLLIMLIGIRETPAELDPDGRLERLSWRLWVAQAGLLLAVSILTMILGSALALPTDLSSAFIGGGIVLSVVAGAELAYVLRHVPIRRGS
jgi:hypothetical protein